GSSWRVAGRRKGAMAGPGVRHVGPKWAGVRGAPRFLFLGSGCESGDEVFLRKEVGDDHWGGGERRGGEQRVVGGDVDAEEAVEPDGDDGGVAAVGEHQR